MLTKDFISRIVIPLGFISVVSCGNNMEKKIVNTRNDERGGYRWTGKEVVQLLWLIWHHGYNWDEISKVVGRSPRACETQYYILRSRNSQRTEEKNEILWGRSKTTLLKNLLEQNNKTWQEISNEIPMLKDSYYETIKAYLFAEFNINPRFISDKSYLAYLNEKENNNQNSSLDEACTYLDKSHELVQDTPRKNCTRWTPVEETTLLQLRKLGNPWSIIAKQLNRTNKACKSHYSRLFRIKKQKTRAIIIKTKVLLN